MEPPVDIKFQTGRLEAFCPRLFSRKVNIVWQEKGRG
jgi:hypothetical protein